MKRKVIRISTSWGKTVVCGWVEGKVFKKSIQGSRHMLRQPRALAISAQALDEAEKYGAKVIEIYDSESNKTYSASLEHFKHYAFSIRRGYAEKQFAMTLDLWTCDGIEPKVLKTVKNIEAASQLRMFV